MKVNEKLSILFLLEKSNAKDGLILITIRLTVNSKCSELSLGKSIVAEAWNQETNRRVGKTAEIQSINNAIDKAKVSLTQHFDTLENQHEIATAQMVKLSYLGKLVEEKEIEKTLLFAVDYMIIKLEEKVSKKKRSGVP